VKGEWRKWLDALSERAIAQIAVSHGLKAEREQVARHLAETLDPAEEWERLSKEERNVLFTLLFAARNGSVAERGPLPSGMILATQPFCQALRSLCRRGWLVPFRNEYRERVYVFPRELRHIWLRHLLRQDAIAGRDDPGLFQVEPPTVGLAQALFHVLVALDEEPWERTPNGEWPQRAARKLDAGLDLDPAILAQTEWEQSGLPSWISFLLQMAGQIGLTEEKDGRLTVVQEKWATWLCLSYAEQAAILYEAVRRLLLYSGSPEDTGFLDLIEQLPTSRWHAAKDLVLWRRSFVGGQREEERLVQELLKPLQALGWLELGWDHAGGTWFRRRELPTAADLQAEALPLYVQGDGEILVPETFPFKERYLLAKMADFMGGEVYFRYLITEASLHRAKKNGHTAEGLIALLEKWSAVKVPDEVKQAIRQGMECRGEVWMEPAVLVRADEDTVRHLHNLCRLLEKEAHVLGHCVLALSKADWDEVKKRMDAESIPVTKVRVPLRFGRATPFLPFENEPGQGMEVEPELPDLENPRNSGLPRIWFSSYRAYSSEMVREILRQAVTHGLEVGTERKGKTVCLLPERFCRQGESWMVEGRGGSGKVERVMIRNGDRIRLLERGGE
jgi:hypothetical protein